MESFFYDGSVSAAEWAQYLPMIAGAEYGVAGAQDWQVLPSSSSKPVVRVQAGTGWGNGVTDRSAYTMDVPCQPSGSRSTDLIVLRRNWGEKSSRFMAVRGQYRGGKFTVDRRTEPGVVDDQPLALVQWKPEKNQVESITDLRVWAGPGGIYANNKQALDYLRYGIRAVVNEVEYWRGTTGGPWLPPRKTFDNPRLQYSGIMQPEGGGWELGTTDTSSWDPIEFNREVFSLGWGVWVKRDGLYNIQASAFMGQENLPTSLSLMIGDFFNPAGASTDMVDGAIALSSVVFLKQDDPIKVSVGTKDPTLPGFNFNLTVTLII